VVPEVGGSNPLGQPIFTPIGAIAQLGERLNGIQEVSGSIPLSSTKLQLATSARCITSRAIAQLGSALPWGGRGRGFESR